ncbi:hypothetical protein [Spartinivicinus poritis]|uniref:Polysaccharide deacetylase n=1 Tax=Spartinivicinus poritis TaxID=2994640 RepID=A0ABT5UGB9_9GAMM|nr:hypothetical protein [Spartinivicinus sp. A2-2]MDE1464532.1 hypothetical protein [Spartinivicinus sp. A2-2]
MKASKYHHTSIQIIIFFLLLFLTLWNTANAQGKVIAIVSVDWEGRTLEAENLQAMNDFRNDYPQVGLLQFLNAAYYTKPNTNHQMVTQAIRSVLRPSDEHGLHIHAWRSLVEAAGVNFRTEPNWSYPGPITLNRCRLTGDCGHNVPISAYTHNELRSIIQFSNQMLVDAGFNYPVSFRAGGWMAAPHVINALSAEGFKFDSSAAATILLKGRRWSDRLYNWLTELWGGVNTVSQPYLIGPSYAPLWELPDNGILADYITGKEMLTVLKRNVNKWRQNPEKNVYISIGFHQESASRYISRIREAVDLFEDYTKENNIPFEWATLPLDPASFN